MSRPSFPSTINDDRQLDLVEFLETASPRPFSLWREDIRRLEVVPDGDMPTALGLPQRPIQAVIQNRHD